MITLTVYHPTKESRRRGVSCSPILSSTQCNLNEALLTDAKGLQFLAFLDKNYAYSVETISGYPNKDGKHEPGTIHVEDYSYRSYDGIIGLDCYWHDLEGG